MNDLDAALAAHPPAPDTARSTTTVRRCLHPVRTRTPNPDGTVECLRCRAVIDPTRIRRGRQSRNYGNRAELDVARRYGGTKVGHAGGPVDVRGTDWNTQVKTHRRNPPAEWTKAFGAMAASTDRLPRLLVRYVQTGGRPPIDYFVIPAAAWLDWYGKDGGGDR